MPLEAGSAMHEVFAAVRLWQLWWHDLKEPHRVYDESVRTDCPLLIWYHGCRLFGQDRFEAMLEEVRDNEDDRTNCINFCLQSLYSSGFYDDPRDTRRTMANLEEAAIMYIDRWNFTRNPIWVRDLCDVQSDVGIEIAFDVVITFVIETVNEAGISDTETKHYRFCGKLDGLHLRDGALCVGENKTASRLDDAWRASFDMSSQITGYTLAGSVFTGVPIEKGIVWGLAIPLPKSYDNGGLVDEYIKREPFMIARWFSWFYHTVEMYETYQDDPYDAPKYTHSCNRYFRSCSMIPFCTADDEEQHEIIDEMVIEEWSPLHTLDTTKAGD